VRRRARSFTLFDKTRVVARLVKNAKGTLLDVGARDRRLAGVLAQGGDVYFSADRSGAHDYSIDLEKPLPFRERQFDMVVCLDVLEHVERIHAAFGELARVAGSLLIIALPCLGSWGRRWHFLWHGHLGTGKYDLTPDPIQDRHRWLTVYPQINAFMETQAIRNGFELERTIEQVEGSRLSRLIKLTLAWLRLVPEGAFTGRCIYVLRKREER